MLERLTQPPSFLGTYLGHAPGFSMPAGVVWHGNGRRVVGLAEEVDPESLSVGDSVILGHELNVIVRKAETGLEVGGDTAVFERWVPDGRLVVRCRDEEFVAQASHTLREADLEQGDLVRSHLPEPAHQVTGDSPCTYYKRPHDSSSGGRGRSLTYSGSSRALKCLN